MTRLIDRLLPLAALVLPAFGSAEAAALANDRDIVERGAALAARDGPPSVDTYLRHSELHE